jgi:hypothetical protein
MRVKTIILMLCGWLGPGALALGQDTQAAGGDAAFTATGELLFPAHYREWVYLSSGFDMSYSPPMQRDNHYFDNVFVNPAAYRAFVATGHWPNGTVLVLEVRRAEQRGSINRNGSFQDDSQGVEVHVRDAARFGERWAFFGFGSSGTGKLIPFTAECYSCHAAHAAVDTTFVQFYPTLLPIAQRLGTFSEAYRKESAEADKPAGR